MKYFKITERFSLFFAAVFFVAFSSFTFNVIENNEADIVTVKGEVLDLACFMKSGAKGKDHKGCAATCIGKGGPVGLLGTDGKVYLLVEDHENAAAFKELKNFAAENVTVTGVAHERSGLNGIVLAKVEAMK
ncbi:hypothetical protein BH23BAC1_BH23BAC1_36070 [soil metagenome]